ncbi:MAG: GxxExxY protein [Sandaracinaceae bacterium]|nr:GxxExxY protein [Sandaracinaceae bacterium]
MTDFGALTHEILGACIEVHRHLGPGLLESAYDVCLARELEVRGLRYARRPTIGLDYKGQHLACAFQPDFVVEDVVVVELKAVASLLRVHEAQLRTYVRLTGAEVGLLVNFHAIVLREGGIRRVRP